MQSKKNSVKEGIVVRQPVQLSTIPEYLNHAGPKAGLEEMTRADWTLPRLGLCQSMSPQRVKSDAKYIAGLEEGHMFNSITRQNYGDKIKVVPLMFFKTRFRFGEELGTLLCQSQDAKFGLGDPGGDCATCKCATFNDGEAPDCSLFYNYPSIVLPESGMPGLDALVVVSFKSSELKVARDWNALLRLRNTDAFAGVYDFATTEQKNDKGRWFTRVVSPAGWVSQEQYNFARDAYNAVRDTQAEGRLKVDVNDLGGGREPGEEG